MINVNLFLAVFGLLTLAMLVCGIMGIVGWLEYRRFVRVLPPDVHLPAYVDLAEGFWTPEDRASWLHFRGSSAGRKLGVLLNNTVTASAVAATADKVNSEHACGRACGVRDTIQVLDMLLPEQISPAGAQSSNLDGSASQDAADSFAHLAP